MKAMIFAAGLGSRLGELTRHKPKPLMEAGGKTLIEHVIGSLKSAGVNAIMINLHYLGAEIKKFLAANGNFQLDIHYSEENELLGTGGGLKKCEEFFKHDKDFIIYNADVYCELDLRKVVNCHRLKDSLATLVVMPRISARQLIFDKNDNLAGWDSTENTTQASINCQEANRRLAFAGIHVCSPKLFNYMRSDNGNFSILKSYLLASQHGEKVNAFCLENDYWIDVGRPESLEELRKHLVK